MPLSRLLAKVPFSGPRSRALGEEGDVVGGVDVVVHCLCGCLGVAGGDDVGDALVCGE